MPHIDSKQQGVDRIPFDPSEQATVIAFGSPKGGSGKTTLAVAFANELSRRASGPVRVADLDYNANAFIHMTEARKQEGTPQIDTRHLHSLVNNPRLLGSAIKEMAEGAQFLLLDTPGAIEDLGAQLCLSVADIVVIPVQPSGYDFDATVRAIGPLNKISAMNPDQIQVLALNRPNSTNVGKHMQEQIKETFGKRDDIRLLKTAVRQAVAYQESRATGLPVWMLGDNGKTPMKDIPALVSEVLAKRVEVINGNC